jgi:hypothetical protein
MGRLRPARRNTILNVVEQNVWLREAPVDHPPRSRGSRLFAVSDVSGAEGRRCDTHAEGSGLGEVPWLRVTSLAKT